DLDNRGRRQNLRVRGLQEGEDSPAQLKVTLTAIFNELLSRPRETPIEFIRAHRALRPRGPPEAPSRDVICCLALYALKEEILHAARNRGEITHEGQHLQLYSDLCPATLGYRRALKPLTRMLVAQKIRYRWTFPTVKSHRLTDKHYAQCFLTTDELTAEVRERLTQYFTENDTSEVTPLCLWEAHKSVMRGHFIKQV
ncbi:Hypothetical predicted protein, partial [Pelobates cultripes]